MIMIKPNWKNITKALIRVTEGSLQCNKIEKKKCLCSWLVEKEKEAYGKYLVTEKFNNLMECKKLQATVRKLSGECAKKIGTNLKSC
jgi:hypothetical protein